MFEDHHSHRLGDARTEASRRSHDDRAQATRARQAAEALFVPKRQAEIPAESPAPEPEGDSSGERVRKPRILRALSQQPAQGERPTKPHKRKLAAALAAAEQPQPPKVPASDLPRIRTWLRYGMTVSQVAELYGVVTAEITHLLETT